MLLVLVYNYIVVVFYRDWPQPILLKQLLQENKLGFPVWDPRVGICFILFLGDSLMADHKYLHFVSINVIFARQT